MYKESRENIPCILGSGGNLYIHIPVKSHEFVVSALEEGFRQKGIDVSPFISRSDDLWAGYFPGMQLDDGGNRP